MQSASSEEKARVTSVYHVLVEDVISCIGLLEAENSETHRRNAVRAIFAAVEGILAGIKRTLLIVAVRQPETFPTEVLAMLREETYVVDERGNAKSRSYFVPLLANIRFVVRALNHHPTIDLKPKFDHPAWNHLQTSLELRHRLTHPKLKEDLAVSTEDVGKAVSGLFWFVALAVEAQELTASVGRDLFTAHQREIINSVIKIYRDDPPSEAPAE